MTQVDLGDDLLAPTVVTARTESFPSHSPDDQFESARILMNEGLVEDAKRILRKILITDPHHAPARQSLKEILEREMKELLGEDSPVRRPRIFERKGKEARGPQRTSEDVLRELDQEFNLGLMDPVPDPAAAPPVEADVKGTSAADRIDLGIAFLEMGLHEAAISHFRAAREALELELEPDTSRLISATALLARAYIEASQAFEATQILHPVLRDSELPPGDKIEFFYLMGLAQEKLGKRKAALPWFEKVREIDPRYRDVTERLRKPVE